MNAPLTHRTTQRDAYEIVVIGAGPAGLAAATLAAGAGLTTLLLDENPSPGGQVYRAVTTTPIQKPGMLGPDYTKGAALVSALSGTGAEYVAGATVWHLDRDRIIGLSIGGASRLIKAGRVILATGALERPFPIPGWTLPGVMTIGAAQTVMKASGLVPKGRVALAGHGPLLWLYAAQLLRAGGTIEAIFDTTPRANWLKALPYAPGFLLSPYFRKGLAMMGEVKARTRIIRNVTDLSATGADKLERLHYVAGGKAGELALDALFLHQGVVPNVNLAMAAGAEHHWDEAQACFRPKLDGHGRCSVDGIFIAGDGAGIGGAEAAVERGRLAAIAAAREIAPDRKVPESSFVENALAQAMRGRAFLDTLFRPADRFRIPPEADTVVCRCEEVTA
ncbi:MAG: FAD-dependent oxidoreductase, partial [Aestuariivirga sp.]